MTARDAIAEALANFCAIPSIVERNRIPGIERVTPETNFERVERNRREAKLARERAEWRGCDSASSCDDNDWS